MKSQEGGASLGLSVQFGTNYTFRHLIGFGGKKPLDVNCPISFARKRTKEKVNQLFWELFSLSLSLSLSLLLMATRHTKI